MKLQQCKFCVMDTSDPQITFDGDGVCNHCIDAREAIASLGTFEDKKARLKHKIKEIKKRNANNEYDVIMGVSGGVDSSYALVKANELGLRILAVHCDTGWNSDIAVSNIKSLVEILNIDLETIVVNWPIMRSIQRSFFLASVSNCDIPQDHAIVAVNNELASRLGVRDFISGGNLAGESIMPSSWGYDARDLTHIKDINNKFDDVSLRKFPKMSFFSSYFYFPFIKGIRNYRLLNDLDYNPLEAKNELMENYGWKDYGGKHHESVFTRFYQAHYLPQKFNFDKRKGHLSSLIAAGLITRDDALVELKKEIYKHEDKKRDEVYFINKLGFTEAEWDSIMKAAPVSHYDYKTHSYLHSKMTKLKKAIESRGIKVRRSW